MMSSSDDGPTRPQSAGWVPDALRRFPDDLGGGRIAAGPPRAAAARAPGAALELPLTVGTLPPSNGGCRA